jgi:hypothetical protein
LIVSSIQSCREVDTTSGEPITLYNTVGRYFFVGSMICVILVISQ